MFFVSNLRSSFQAVGRGFDPRLPLHFFNNLRGPANLCSVCAPFKIQNHVNHCENSGYLARNVLRLTLEGRGGVTPLCARHFGLSLRE